jgi:hypothetical protein
MCLFSYFWDSEVHLNNLAFGIEVVGCLIEIIIAIIAVVTLPKVWTEERKERIKKLAEFFGIVAAIVFLVALVSNRRTSALQDERISREIHSVQAAATNALSKVSEVVEGQKDRTITEGQSNLFMLLVKDYPKIPVRVFVGLEDPETYRYAHKIRLLLNSAGFNTKDNEEVKELGFAHAEDNDTNSFDVFTFQYGTNREARYAFSPGLALANGKSVRVETNSFATFNDLNWAFGKIGVAPAFSEDDQILKSGEFGILVPMKNH